MDYTIYTVAAVLFVIYLFITLFNRGRARKRKSKKFMEGHTRSDRKKKE